MPTPEVLFLFFARGLAPEVASKLRLAICGFPPCQNSNRRGIIFFWAAWPVAADPLFFFIILGRNTLFVEPESFISVKIKSICYACHVAAGGFFSRLFARA